MASEAMLVLPLIWCAADARLGGPDDDIMPLPSPHKREAHHQAGLSFVGKADQAFNSSTALNPPKIMRAPSNGIA